MYCVYKGQGPDNRAIDFEKKHVDVDTWILGDQAVNQMAEQDSFAYIK